MDKPTNNDEKILKYIVLPLYRLSITLFNHKYITSYINKEGTVLFIQLNDDHDFYDNTLYRGIVTIENNDFHMFITDDLHQQDINFILQGKYSRISQAGKQLIINLSGLNYMKEVNGKIKSSSLLLGLLRHPEYRKYLENKLEVKFPPETKDTEYIDILSENVFIETLYEEENKP